MQARIHPGRLHVDLDAQRCTRCGLDKPEVAARVSWSGAGLNLGTGRPKPRAIRQAVRAILAEPRYRSRARALAAEYASYDALACILSLIEEIRGVDTVDARSPNPDALAKAQFTKLPE